MRITFLAKAPAPPNPLLSFPVWTRTPTYAPPLREPTQPPIWCPLPMPCNYLRSPPSGWHPPGSNPGCAVWRPHSRIHSLHARARPPPLRYMTETWTELRRRFRQACVIPPPRQPPHRRASCLLLMLPRWASHVVFLAYCPQPQTPVTNLRTTRNTTALPHGCVLCCG